VSHYRTIEVEGNMYRYVVGRHKTKIDGVGLFDNDRIGCVYSEEIVEVRPSHVEKIIRRELSIPQREYDWDKPATKVDPGPRTRGFIALIGAHIADIKVSAINEVILTDTLGRRFAIESQDSHHGVGVISLRKLAD
jgi:hypothetical protein